MQQEFKLGQLEALLFAAGEPLGVPQLAELLGLNKPQTWELLGQLQEEYNT
jgi:segregation and condensation protein B